MRVPESEGSRLVGLLALTGVLGLATVATTAEGATGIGIWPVVGATALFLLTTRTPWPVLTVLIGLVGFATIQVERPVAVAAGFAVGLALQATVTWWVLCRGRRERPSLATTSDLARLLVATTVGALCMAVTAGLTSVATGWSEPVTVAMATGTAGYASHMVLLPLLGRLRRSRGYAQSGERIAQWIGVLVLPPGLFLLAQNGASLVLLIPALVWSSLRSHVHEAFAHLFVVAGVAITFTALEVGPLTAGDGTATRWFGPDSSGVLLALFVGTCALVVLSLTVSVGERDDNARAAFAERDRLRNVVDSISGVSIIGTDTEGRITLFSPGSERSTGYQASEVLHQPVDVFYTPETIAQMAEALGVDPDLDALRRALRGRAVARFLLTRDEGEIRQHLLTINQVRDDRGELTGFVSTSEDVTEQVETERRLREALEVERAAMERLREVDRAKDTFVSNVSHELRTPITSILGYVEMLQEEAFGTLASGQRDALSRIERNSARLLSLIGDLLTMSRIQETGPGLAHRTLDLRDVVSTAMADVRPTHEHRALDVSADLPSEPVQCRGDRDQLERVVINLLSNAVKFTPDGGRVSVRVTDEGEHVALEVADTGIGVPADEQEQVFERFFRSTLSQRNEIPGTGLGLPIARTIVERHGGQVEVDSEIGRGTTMRVLLPRDTDGPTPRTDPVRVAP